MSYTNKRGYRFLLCFLLFIGGVVVNHSFFKYFTFRKRFLLFLHQLFSIEFFVIDRSHVYLVIKFMIIQLQFIYTVIVSNVVECLNSDTFLSIKRLGK